MKIKHINHLLLKIIRTILLVFGATFLFAIIIAFTPLPFYVWYNHALAKAGIHRPADYIIVLGGGGMPSETALMRTWYGARTANYFTKAKVIIALPGNLQDSLSSINLMKKELLIRGIDPDRIILEQEGTNTRSQAVNIHKKITKYEVRSTKVPSHPLTLIPSYPDTLLPSILIVTSPEHLTRSVLTFRKAGFKKVDGLPAFEKVIESDITFNDTTLGGRNWIPGIGGNLALRYQFWTQLRYEELMMREYLALFYYKLKGWI